MADVTATDEQGRVVAKLYDYKVRVLAVRPEYPTADELAAPSVRDDRLVQQGIRNACEALNVDAPSLELAHSPNVSQASAQERNANTALLAARALRGVGDSPKTSAQRRKHVRVVTTSSGKPELIGDAAGVADISVSHDEAYHLVAVGKGRQGCDIETICPRSRAKWTSILGTSRSAILDELIQSGDSLDCAATRIWSALETVRKAYNASDPVFSVKRRVGKSVLLETILPSGTWQVITLPITLTRKPERMIAVFVPASPIDSTSISPPISFQRQQPGFRMIE